MTRNFILLVLLFSQPAFSQTKPVLVTDMLKIKSITSITASKDGSKAAFTLQTIEPDENSKLDYKYVSQIYTISSLENSSPIQITSAKEGASQPAWSPDGKKLAFVRATEGKPQIFILSMDGGEAHQLTKYKYGATSPKWSPDGSHILFMSSIPFQDMLNDSLLNAEHNIPVWATEKPGFERNEYLQKSTAKADADGNMAEIRAYLQNDEKDRKAVVLNKLDFQNEFSVTSEENFSQLFIIGVNEGSMPKEVTHGFYSFINPSFTPDGKKIIFTARMDSLLHPDRVLETSIFISDIDGSHLQMLLGEKGKRFNNPSISHSGKLLAFQYSNISFVSVPVMAIMPLNGSFAQKIDVDIDRNKGEAVWSSDDNFIFVTAQSNGGAPLYKVNIHNGKAEQLTSFDNGTTAFDLLNDKIILSKTQVTDPSELYISDMAFKSEKQLTHFNNWVSEKNISIPEKRTFTNSQGMTIEYWIMKPINFRPGVKYPLLLEIHGGPSAMWGPGETSMWHEFQYFCSRGYGVVYCNPRGSGGYGLQFLKANVNDWGDGPTSDVLTALDKAVAIGWADTSKLLITGGSYAGYLTAWIIAHDHRFKAACSQRGVYDLATFFGEGNAWRLVPNYFGGYPWEPKVKEELIKESPITYVQNITTPYIIFHGGSDRRTGFVQGEMMYRSLKVLGRPVEYVVHPNATHELTRSGDNRQRIDQLLRTYEFFQRYIK